MYNAQTRWRKSIRGDKTEMQYLIKKLEEHKYVYFRRTNDEETTLTDMFFCLLDLMTYILIGKGYVYVEKKLMMIFPWWRSGMAFKNVSKKSLQNETPHQRGDASTSISGRYDVVSTSKKGGNQGSKEKGDVYTKRVIYGSNHVYVGEY